MHRNALTANNVIQQQTGPLRRCMGVAVCGCVRFMFGKTSLATSIYFFVTLQFCLLSSVSFPANVNAANANRTVDPIRFTELAPVMMVIQLQASKTCSPVRCKPA